jgi:hypothetical protein
MIFGYLDAGSGSLILQAVIAGAAGIGVAFKAMRMRLARSGAATAEADGEEAVEDDALTADS